MIAGLNGWQLTHMRQLGGQMVIGGESKRFQTSSSAQVTQAEERDTFAPSVRRLQHEKKGSHVVSICSLLLFQVFATIRNRKTRNGALPLGRTTDGSP